MLIHFKRIRDLIAQHIVVDGVMEDRKTGMCIVYSVPEELLPSIFTLC